MIVLYLYNTVQAELTTLYNPTVSELVAYWEPYQISVMECVIQNFA